MARGKKPEFALKTLVFADECDNSSFPAFSATSYLLSNLVLVWQLSTLDRYGVKEAIVLSSKPIEILYSNPLERMKSTKCNLNIVARRR